jgi:hypothetical protein
MTCIRRVVPAPAPVPVPAPAACCPAVLSPPSHRSHRFSTPLAGTISAPLRHLHHLHQRHPAAESAPAVALSPSSALDWPCAALPLGHRFTGCDRPHRPRRCSTPLTRLAIGKLSLLCSSNMVLCRR